MRCNEHRHAVEEVFPRLVKRLYECWVPMWTQCWSAMGFYENRIIKSVAYSFIIYLYKHIYSMFVDSLWKMFHQNPRSDTWASELRSKSGNGWLAPSRSTKHASSASSATASAMLCQWETILNWGMFVTVCHSTEKRSPPWQFLLLDNLMPFRWGHIYCHWSWEIRRPLLTAGGALGRENPGPGKDVPGQGKEGPEKCLTKPTGSLCEKRYAYSANFGKM